MTQFNIELSPREVELALKLAKFAGFDSIADWIRFSLLQSAEPNAASAHHFQSTDSPDRIRRIDAQLRRLHNELRGFLSESPLGGDAKNLYDADEQSDSARQLKLALNISTDDRKDTLSDALLQLAKAPEKVIDENPERRSAIEAEEDFQDDTQPSKQPGIQTSVQAGAKTGINITPERRATGLNEAVDELEEMANAAFKNSPQLGFTTDTAGLADHTFVSAAEKPSQFERDEPSQPDETTQIPQKEDGEVVSSQIPDLSDVKLDDISGNLPPRKRKS